VTHVESTITTFSKVGSDLVLHLNFSLIKRWGIKERKSAKKHVTNLTKKKMFTVKHLKEIERKRLFKKNIQKLWLCV